MSAPTDFAEQMRAVFGLSTTPLGDTVEDAQESARVSYRDRQTTAEPSKPAAPIEPSPPVFALAPDKTYSGAGSYGNALAAKVAAANRANYCVRAYHAYLVERLRPFLNQKVLKNTSWGTSLTKKVETAIGTIYLNPPGEEYFTISTQGHWISARCTVSRGYGSDQYRSSSWEAYATVGKTGGTDTLQELCEPPDLRTDYTETEIRGKRKVVEGLKEQLREAESALYGWGEYDR